VWAETTFCEAGTGVGGCLYAIVLCDYEGCFCFEEDAQTMDVCVVLFARNVTTFFSQGERPTVFD